MMQEFWKAKAAFYPYFVPTSTALHDPLRCNILLLGGLSFNFPAWSLPPISGLLLMLQTIKPHKYKATLDRRHPGRPYW